MMRWGAELCDGVSTPAKCAACALQSRGLGRPLARAFGAIPPALGRVARSLSGRLGTALSMSDLISRNAAMQREMLATVDRFVVLTDWALRAACANGAPRDRLALNRLGLGQETVRPKPGPEEQPTVPPITVGYLGRFDRIKGGHDLGRAVASLPRDVPIRVQFRGPVTRESERACLAELRDLVAGDCRVEFGPPVASEEAPAVLAGFDALCCPAICLEGGPTVAIEAHAVGTPVIGTRIGGLAELVQDGVNGRLVPRATGARWPACWPRWPPLRATRSTAGDDVCLGRERWTRSPQTTRPSTPDDPDAEADLHRDGRTPVDVPENAQGRGRPGRLRDIASAW